ncbi:hypothetical protein RT717_24860 [Imperialibacter roseus]|uniref:Lipoprotein n=1 Tax=Imperialibacter roseus TaxID=1324217 RepID=A0ABZ0IPB3_9BACT|nr:hypothetical protein [Imperialibacter roseus]WOK06309.1 hypothetical protein RT717_24860 [Imperialibacter roseus]
MSLSIKYSWWMGFVIFFASCEPTVKNDAIVFFNDFESADMDNIVGGKLMNYNGNQVIGNYFDDGFSIALDGLPEHNYITISFDLFIHDSWDGNLSYPAGPDWWLMLVDGQSIIETTFSNGICNALWCIQQSYPQNGWRMNDPKTGAFKTDLPLLCYYSELSNGTSIYQISKTVGHSADKLEIRFFDRLTQPIPNDICDESWSLDNLTLKTLTLN